MGSRSHRGRPSAVVLAVLLTGGLVLSAQQAFADTFRVRGIFDGGFVWSPRSRSIGVGDTVRWKAVEGNHNVQSRGSNWSFFRNLPEGTAVTRTFNRRGTFRYYCTIHGSVQNGVCSGMCGRIVVG
jgi:plastocyanin